MLARCFEELGRHEVLLEILTAVVGHGHLAVALVGEPGEVVVFLGFHFHTGLLIDLLDLLARDCLGVVLHVVEQVDRLLLGLRTGSAVFGVEGGRDILEEGLVFAALVAAGFESASEVLRDVGEVLLVGVLYPVSAYCPKDEALEEAGGCAEWDGMYMWRFCGFW